MSRQHVGVNENGAGTVLKTHKVLLPQGLIGAIYVATGGTRRESGRGRAMQGFEDFFASLPANLPAMMVMGVVAIAGAFIGTVVGVRIARPKGPPPRQAEPTMGRAGELDERKPVQRLTTERARLQPENPAFRSYQQILEEKGVPAKEQDALLREFAGQLDEMRGRLIELQPATAELKALVDEAREALDGGDFAAAAARLTRLGGEEAESGREHRRQAEKRMLSASLARLVMGDLELAQRNHAEAAECYRLAVETVPAGRDELLAECLNKHGTASYHAGDMDGAVMSFERALKLLERLKGEVDPDVATGLNNLALLHYARGDFAAAEPLYRRALTIDEQLLGEDAPGVATDLNNLALLYKKQGRYQDAEPLLKRALAIKEKAFAPGHPSLVTGLRNYASLLRALGRGDEAGTFEARAAALPPKRRGEDAEEAAAG